MRLLQSYLILSLVILFSGCSKSNKNDSDVVILFENGEFSKANGLIDEMLAGNSYSEEQKAELLYYQDLMRRIRREFSLEEEDVKNALGSYFGDSVLFFIPNWEKRKSLEYRMIDGEKRYFKNAVPNLFRLDSLANKARVKLRGEYADPLKDFCLKNTGELLKETSGYGELFRPISFEFEYTITVKPDVVPAGEAIRCWMPFPKEINARQTNVSLLETFPSNYQIASDSFKQRSIYCEQIAEKGKETIFKVRFQTTSFSQYFNLSQMECFEYNTVSNLVKDNTKERLPHIVFSEKIRNMADEICGNEMHPVREVEMLYNWICNNITWASALEYSVMSNIPEYVLDNRHGDCGMQTLLFMSMARYRGIPVKWQSGWMLHPGEVNLHDWCEVYYEGIGWVPLDQSFGLQKSKNEKIKTFYQSGIDSYRLIVNDDFSQPLFPAKIWPRSEPVDFQRGELEWKKGNLYFGDWTYKMNVTYKDQL